MKLKDFKDKPERYDAIVKSLKEKGITFNDESDFNEILAKVNAYNDNVVIGAMANAANKMRGYK